MEEPELFAREEFNKNNYAVNLPEMADVTWQKEESSTLVRSTYTRIPTEA